MEQNETQSVTSTLSLVVSSNVVEWLRREERSQSWLARKLGQSSAWMSRKLNGQSQWLVDDLEPLAEVLGVPLEDLVRNVAAESVDVPTAVSA